MKVATLKLANKPVISPKKRLIVTDLKILKLLRKIKLPKPKWKEMFRKVPHLQSKTICSLSNAKFALSPMINTTRFPGSFSVATPFVKPASLSSEDKKDQT